MSAFMENMKATAILEVLGRPAQNVLDALNMLIDRIKKEEEIKLISNTIHEAVPTKDTLDLFTSFAEVEIEFKSLNNLIYFLFAYMPSNVEISHPEKAVLSNHDLNQLTNLLMHRLHQYDAVTKNVVAERDLMAKELYKYKPELFTKNPDHPNNQVQVKEEKSKKVAKKKRI